MKNKNRKTENYQLVRTYIDTNEGIDELLALLEEGWEINAVSASNGVFEYILWNLKK